MSLALTSSISVLGLERVCPRKGCPWPCLGFFLCPWPWPRAFCPRLHSDGSVSKKSRQGYLVCLTNSRNDLNYYRNLQSLICNRLCNFQTIVIKNQLQGIVIYELQIIEPWLATTMAYLSTLPISSGESRFRGFLPITRSQQKISRYHDLAQEFLNLKINQFFEKFFNFVCEYCFFLKGKEYSSTPNSTDLIFFKSFDLKINV